MADATRRRRLNFTDGPALVTYSLAQTCPAPAPYPLERPCLIWQRATVLDRRLNARRGNVKYRGRGVLVPRLIIALLQARDVFDLTWKALHKCDVPLCIEPSHLWPGTSSENRRDAQQKGRAK